MDQETHANRLEILERKVDRLEQLPHRMDSLEEQISQFRNDVRVEFSAVRGEMKELHGIAMTQMRALHQEVISRIALLDEGLNGAQRSRSGRGREQRTKGRPPKRRARVYST